MVSSDTIVGIVGAVILTGAMIAVFYYEADRDTPGAPADIGEGSEQFMARFVEHDDHEPSLDQDIELAQGGSWNQVLDPPPYTFEVRVEVEWDPDDLEDTPLVEDLSFKVEILDQDAGNTAVATATQSPLRYNASNAKATPDSMEFTVAANSTEQAESFLDAHMDSDAVQSNVHNWTLVVTLEEDGYAADDPTGESITRTGNVKVHYMHYVPELVPDEA